MILTFLDADIPPLSDGCDYDGIVIKDGHQFIGTEILVYQQQQQHENWTNDMLE